jgi:hypothetical protein
MIHGTNAIEHARDATTSNYKVEARKGIYLSGTWLACGSYH